MSHLAGSYRFVYNKVLALQKERYEANKQTRFSYTALANQAGYSCESVNLFD